MYMSCNGYSCYYIFCVGSNPEADDPVREETGEEGGTGVVPANPDVHGRSEDEGFDL